MHNEWLSFNHYRTFLFVKFNLKSINSIFSQRFYYSHLGKENSCSSQVKVHKLQDKDKYQFIEGTVEIYIQGTGQTIYREIITKKVIEGTVQRKQQKYIYIQLTLIVSNSVDSNFRFWHQGSSAPGQFGTCVFFFDFTYKTSNYGNTIFLFANSKKINLFS